MPRERNGPAEDGTACSRNSAEYWRMTWRGRVADCGDVSFESGCDVWRQCRQVSCSGFPQLVESDPFRFDLRATGRAEDFAFGFYPIFERIPLPVAAFCMELICPFRDSCLHVVAIGHWLAMN